MSRSQLEGEVTWSYCALGKPVRAGLSGPHRGPPSWTEKPVREGTAAPGRPRGVPVLGAAARRGHPAGWAADPSTALHRGGQPSPVPAGSLCGSPQRTASTSGPSAGRAQGAGLVRPGRRFSEPLAVGLPGLRNYVLFLGAAHAVFPAGLLSSKQ